MVNINEINRASCAALIATMALTMSACGGGGKTDEDDGCFWNFIYGMEMCMGNLLNSSRPNQGVGFEADTGGALSSELSPDSAITNEYEPNSLLDNANVVTLTAVSTGSPPGIDIIGNVKTSGDTADFFILAPTRSSSYDIFLCGDNCTEIRQSDAVYLMVYDQSQTTIASTSVGGNVTQKLTVNLTAGLAYYVEVNGYNMAGVEYHYRLKVTDSREETTGVRSNF